MRFYVLWRIIRAPRQGFRHIFLRTFCVPAMHCLHAKTGVLMHSCALLCSGALLVRYGRGSGAFFCALFVFEGGFARFGAILAKRR